MKQLRTNITALVIFIFFSIGLGTAQAQSAASFYWSSSGPISGLQCTQIIEGASPAEHTWRDNYLCTDRDVGLRWSPSGPIAGMQCTQIIEGAEPAEYTWRDNYLCLPISSQISLHWSPSGPIQGLTCVQTHEGRDPYGWHDNYLCYNEQPNYEQPSYIDLLTIIQITNVKPAGGLDAAGQFAFGAIGAAISAGATAATGGTITASSLVDSVKTGVRVGEFLDQQFSGQDDLIVKVDGRTLLPSSGTYFPMQGGQVIWPNIQAAFRGSARISLIEYDSGSDNDDLGGLKVTGGRDYVVTDAVVLAPLEEDGSIYYVTYKVEANRGNPQAIVQSILCGTNQCDECFNPDCSGQPYGELDRDGDLEDLKSCPDAFKTTNYIEYPQFLVDDVYLRVCQRP